MSSRLLAAERAQAQSAQSNPDLERHGDTTLWLKLRLFLSVADHFPGHRAAIKPREIFFHCRGE
jgi:hypothetical protein